MQNYKERSFLRSISVNENCALRFGPNDGKGETARSQKGKKINRGVKRGGRDTSRNFYSSDINKVKHTKLLLTL
jgi:hypothetical protein